MAPPVACTNVQRRSREVLCTDTSTAPQAEQATALLSRSAHGSCLQTRAATSFVKLSSIAAWTPWWMETM
eukprot:1474871-Prymnesium_polylepis.2